MNGSATQKTMHTTAMKRALIIDDEPIINRLNKKILSGLDVEADCRSNLNPQDESLYKEMDYDLVIIDLNLLRKNGGTYLSVLKQREKDIPVIITSGYLKESASDYLEQYENITYIQKPYTMEDFITQVKNLLEA